MAAPIAGDISDHEKGDVLVDFVSNLPDELLLLVLSYVDFKDLCRLRCVCQRLRYLARSDVLWRRLCHEYWLLDVSSNDDENASSSWYKTFLEWYQKLGQFIGCYATIKGHWNRIETSLKDRAAFAILKSLNGPKITQDDQPTCAESSRGIPLDLMCSLHVHNGQTIPIDDEDIGTVGLGGTLSLYDYNSCPSLLSYEEMSMLIPGSGDADDHETNLNTLTVLRCPFNRTTVCMCLDLTGEFKRGFYHEPSCIAVTHNVKVSVATTFVPELSEMLERPRRMFSYHITMAMDKDSPRSRSCQLLTRHWEVTDGNGRVEIVDGDGVIGAYPILKPGTSYSWTSCTTFDTMTGSMGGHFGMVNLQTQEMFNVKCPEFDMKGLPFLRLPDSVEDSGESEDDK